MTIDPVKIPQNVYVEDRIIGPVSLRQLMITIIGGGISYAIWSIVKSANGGSATIVQTALSWLPCLIAAAFAFIKINGITLMRIVLLSIERIDKPRVRVWVPRQGISINIKTYSEHTESVKKRAEPKLKSKKTIDELSQKLDVDFSKYSEEMDSEADGVRVDANEDQPERTLSDITPSKENDDEVFNDIVPNSHV